MRRLGFAAGLLVLLFATTTYAQPGPRPDQPAPDYDHDRWGTLPQDHVWHFRSYTTSFDGPDDNDGDGVEDYWGIPEWVSYELKRGPNKSDLGDRPGWHTIPEWYEQGIAPDDSSYEDSGYDRGHMCMRNHAARLGTNADYNSHSVVNACPQLHRFNDGIWKGLEKKVSVWAYQYGAVWTICGPIVLNSSRYARPSKWIGDAGAGEMKVAVPQWFFKIVVKESESESGDPERPDVLAFIYPHDARLGSSAAAVDHTPYLVSVRQIEDATGLDFFTVLSKEDQDAIETEAARELWPVEEGEWKAAMDAGVDVAMGATAMSATGERLPGKKVDMGVQSVMIARPGRLFQCDLLRRLYHRWQQLHRPSRLI
jgi:DNA/RNA endonuclease G (NUC1)